MYEKLAGKRKNWRFLA